MTLEQVKELVHSQAVGNFSAVSHGISLNQALIPPRRISVTAHDVREGRVTNEQLEVWLVGQERDQDGYKIIMRDNGMFGLAYKGLAVEERLVLMGWYGDLVSTFLGM